ncbi:MAG TPA: hypothetical protein VIO37_12770 [Candidatus Dormibacteraeota bacterium]
MSRRAVRRVDFAEGPVDRRLQLMLRGFDDDYRTNVAPEVRKRRFHMDARALAYMKEKARRRRLAKRRAPSRAA